MPTSLFFKKINENETNKSIIDKFKQYQKENPTEQIYVITAPLGENDYSYDHDSENEDKELHPLHHFDIFYSSNATFKIELNQILEHNHFLDIMDISTHCRYMR